MTLKRYFVSYKMSLKNGYEKETSAIITTEEHIVFNNISEVKDIILEGLPHIHPDNIFIISLNPLT